MAMLMAVLQGRAPARRPHHAAEVSEVAMSRTPCLDIDSWLGGLGLDEILC